MSNDKLQTTDQIETEPDEQMHASPSGDLQAEITRALADAIQSLGYPTDTLDLTLRPIPLEGEWGFGSAAAFQLRRVGAQGSPVDLAAQVAEAVPHLPQLQRVEAVRGYVNFYVDKEWYANRIIGQVLTQREEYGCWPSRGERVMVEYANLNTHKTMHVGHLRNVVLGRAIYNILKCAGFDTVGATYLGDIGMHVMRTMWGYLNFWKGHEPDENRGGWLERIYVDSVYRLDYRERVIELLMDAVRESSAIAAQMTHVLQALADNNPDDAPLAQYIAETLTTRDGPDWKRVLAERDYIVLNLWHQLGEMLLAQSSTQDLTNAGAAPVQPTKAVVGGFLVENIDNTAGTGLFEQAREVGEEEAREESEAGDPFAGLRADYERLDQHRDYWDMVPQWQAEIREMFARWDAHDEELVGVWQETREWSLELLRRIFADLGVSFDAWFFESEVEEPGKEVVDELIAKGMAEDLRPEGAVIVRIDDKLRADPELSKKYEKQLWKLNKDGTREPKEAWRVLVVLRSDGTSLYATKDLELARRKFNDWHVDRSIYVIDSRQGLYFEQVFRTLELWGFKQADKAHHLSYEHVITPEGAISSRRGGAPQYEDLEREALQRARSVVEAREAESPRGLSAEQIDEIARAVAYGALKMGMLDKDNNKVITFEWERALNPESQSATYVQYSHARATRVLEKAPAELLPASGQTYAFAEPEVYETNLLELIARLPEEVARAAEAYKPVVIAMYCFELADAFNNFYHNCPVLRAGSDEKVRARLALTAAARQTIDNALGLLGITAPDIM